jgi:hypothetical protein
MHALEAGIKCLALQEQLGKDVRPAERLVLTMSDSP